MPRSARNKTRFSKITAACAIALGGLTLLYGGRPAEISLIAPAIAAEGKAIPVPAAPISEQEGEQIAVFAGGCFWGIEAVFEHVVGVRAAESGYAGGRMSDADYESVGNGATGHAEAVRVHYDPAKISYNQLLHIFFSVAHDPTQRDRQGPDIGKQYRSAIFPSNETQRAAAKNYVAQLNAAKIWPKMIATRIEAGLFYEAEDYHQDFMAKNPNHPYIMHWDMPKIEALKQYFPDLFQQKQAIAEN